MRFSLLRVGRGGRQGWVLGGIPGSAGVGEKQRIGSGHRVSSLSRYQMNGNLKPEKPRNKIEGPDQGLPPQATLPPSCPLGTSLYLPAVWGSGLPALSELLPGLDSLMLWDTQPWLLRQVDWTLGDGAEFLGRLLPTPGFLGATGVGIWSGRFLTLLPRCLPAPLQGDSDVVAGPFDTGTST